LYAFDFSTASGNRLGSQSTETQALVYWAFNPTLAAPEGGHWTADTWIAVYDGAPMPYNELWKGTLGTLQASDSAFTLNRTYWYWLGGQTFKFHTGIDVVVGTFDPDTSPWSPTADGGYMYVDAVLVKPLWPQVSIRPELRVPGNVQGAGPANDYIDWEDSWKPIDIPVEGTGERVQLNLHAYIDPRYISVSDWQASLPDVPGLDFWTAATGGSAMTAAEFNQLIPAGNYDGSVWVSIDPNYVVEGSATSGSLTTPGLAQVTLLRGLVCCQ
jgi:hypothetical protein